MPKYGKTKICKARLSTKNKKRCGEQFLTKPGPKQKFCSEKCRTANHRILRAEERKKEQRLKDKIERIENRSITSSDFIKSSLKKIISYGKEIEIIDNRKRPNIPKKELKKLSVMQKIDLEQLQKEYDKKEVVYKTRKVELNRFIKTEIERIISLLNMITNNHRAGDEKEKDIVNKKALRIAKSIIKNQRNNELISKVKSFIKTKEPLYFITDSMRDSLEKAKITVREFSKIKLDVD